MECAKLPFREGAVFSVRVGQVGHDSLDLEGAPHDLVIENGRQLVHGKSQPPHACFDLEMDLVGGRMSKNGFGQGRQESPIAYHRGQSVRHQVGDLFLEERAENEDRRGEACLAEFAPFSQGGDGKSLDSLSGKRLRDSDSAMPIGIGFDDRQDLAGGGQIPGDT